MKKVNPHIDLGTGYIQISRLPFQQAIGIRQSIPKSSILGIQTSNGFVDDAIEYSQYEYWFDFQYSSKEPDFEI